MLIIFTIGTQELATPYPQICYNICMQFTFTCHLVLPRICQQFLEEHLIPRKIQYFLRIKKVQILINQKQVHWNEMSKLGISITISWRSSKETLGQSSSDLVQEATALTLVKPGVVHRLDMETSGLVLFAKNPLSYLSSIVCWNIGHL